MLDRLLLDEARLEGMAQGVEAVAAIADPLGVATSRWTRPNGLDIARVRTPIGVIAMIYREPAQRHRRRGGAVRALGQCGDPARRFRMPGLEPGHPRGHRQGAEGGRPARPSAVQIGADLGPRRPSASC
jgi:hypothetical protein